tara:strand:+ start:2080 stop:2520 length:441 start_codon:yes stop_codon:yes gene_type:complete
MTKRAKTYWDEIKDEECHFYGGSMGWEVHLRWDSWTEYDCNTDQHIEKRQLRLQWPWGYRGQEKLPKGEKAQARKDVLLKKKTRKLLAQASANYSEYQELNQRTGGMSHEDWDELFKLKLKGYDLRNYIQLNKLTDGEAYSLFWRM